MIDPGNLKDLTRSILNQTSTKPREGAGQVKRDKVESDRFEATTQRSESRPQSEPISGAQEAGEVVELASRQVGNNPSGALAAQSGLDPDSVLSLIA